MTRSSTRPPGSIFTTSGSPSVRSLARKASYFTSFRSGLADAIVMPAPFDPSIPAEPPDGVPAMGGILLPFLRVAKISSGGVKLKSASMRTTSC
jgi:hypothetical protein